MTVGYFELDRILVLIPVRNEAITIGKVIESLQAWGLLHIRVVDNGSDDNSAAIARAAGAEVIDAPRPGYGQACWQGLQNLPGEIEWILFCDGDGSDDLSQLADFLAARSQFDLILGDRRAIPSARAALTPIQNFGNGLATGLIGLGWGYWYRDLGPLRLIRRSALEHMQMRDRGFGWTVEMQVRAVELGLRIKELPVDYHPRQGGRSKISGTLWGSIQAGSIILTTLARLYWNQISTQSTYRQVDNRDRDEAPLPTAPNTPAWAIWLSTLCLISGCILLAPQGDFRQGVAPQFWVGVSSMGLGFLLSWHIRSIIPLWFWLVTLLTRSLLLPMYPGDDIWRYLWEGMIQIHGFSPYEVAPNAPALLPLHPDWWSQINHPDVTAIYPPVTQLGFRLLASISASVLVFKLAFIAADGLTCWLLSRRFGYTATLLYAWNPLILYTFAGGAHYDSWFILPLVAAWLVFEPTQPRRYLLSAGLLGISIAIKWMTLPMLGFLGWHALRRHGWTWAGWVIVCGCLPFLLSALPFCQVTSCPLIPTDSVFVSRGRSAELIPYLIGLGWQSSKAFNHYYLLPLLGVLFGLLWRSRSILQFAEGYFITVLMLSPIVHAWYFTWLVPFAIASRNLGTRWVSLSAFVYFVLPHRQAMGNPDWLLQPVERIVLWAPLVIGCLGTLWYSQRSPRPNSGKTQAIEPK